MSVHIAAFMTSCFMHNFNYYWIVLLAAVAFGTKHKGSQVHYIPRQCVCVLKATLPLMLLSRLFSVLQTTV